MSSTSSQIEHDTIDIPRSDGRKHDLFSFASMSTSLQQIVHETPTQTTTTTEVEHENKSILLRRSDGVTHDIIKVFKANSDPRGDSLRLSSPTTSSTTEIIRRLTLGKIDMQSFLKSSGKTPIPTQIDTYHPTSVRIVHMSDTHNNLIRLTTNKSNFLPSGDILIHSGNFTNKGDPSEYAKFDDWLSSVKDMYHYRVIVAGNRDVLQLGNDWDQLKSLLPNATHILCHSEAIILGIRIYGCPWHWGHEANYALKPGTPDCNRFQDIPERVDILVTHGPAYGRLDSVILGDIMNARTGKGMALLKEEHWGSKELAEAISRVRPSVHLHGHVRGARGIIPTFGHIPLTINSSMCDREAKVLYTCPHVIRGTMIYTTNRLSNPEYSTRASLNNPNMWEFSIDSLTT